MDSHAKALPNDFTRLNRSDLLRLLGQITDCSEDLWRLTSPSFQQATVESETRQQIATLKRQTRIMIPLSIVVLMFSLIVAQGVSSALKLNFILHVLVSLLAVVFFAFPVLMLIERFASKTVVDSDVPLPVSPSVHRRTKIPFVLKPDFQFPLVLGLVLLLSLVLYQAV